MSVKQRKINLFSGKKIKSALEVTEVILENGLTVYLNEDHNTSEIFGAVGVKVGAKNDPSDATGMAHYQEHMLFKGTTELGTTNWKEEEKYIDSIINNFEKLRNTKAKKEQENLIESINNTSIKASKYEIANEFNNVLRKMGAYNINAYTSFESTIYYNSLPGNQLKKWLEIYAHRFKIPVFRSFQAEMEVVLEEKSMSNDSSSSKIMEEYDKHFFKVHPYGQSSILGEYKDLKAPSLKKMYDFFKTYYVSNNMVLSLSGNFNTQEVLLMIQETFGELKAGKIPEPKQYVEKEFKGRESASVRMSPIRYGMLGFRIPKCGHKDEYIFNVLTGILTNENETGLFDKLRLDNKILNAEISNYNYQDYGQATIYIFPKILKQSLRNAERKVLKEIEKLKNGNFPDWLVDAVKLEEYRSYLLDLEHIDNKGLMLAESFVDDRNALDIEAIPAKIMSVTREDIIRVANIYFGKNYLAFYSRIGFKNKKTKKTKKIAAITSISTETSNYAKQIEAIETKDLKEKFIDFDNDIERSKIGESKFLYTKNPINDIFEFTIYYGVGTHKMPLLEYAADLMNYAGTENLSLDEFKEEFDKIGCTYGIYVSRSYLTISLEGIEKNFEKALLLLNKLLTEPYLDEEYLNILYEDLKASKKVRGKKPEDVFNALNNYVLRKQKSPYKDKYTNKEIKAKKIDDFIDVFEDALDFEAEYYFVGETKREQVEEIIKRIVEPVKNQIKSESPVKQNFEAYTENEIFFTNFKNTNQTRIQFYIDVKDKVLDEIPVIDSFNRYFDGGFTGILLQEIREKRSLAYTADGYLSVPFSTSERVCFFGSIETAGEKTIEALEVFLNLLKNLPKEPLRLETIKAYLINSSLTTNIHFRNLAQTIDAWQMKGYTEDPSVKFLKEYRKMDFEKIYNFYEKYLKGKPITVSLVGNSTLFELKKLKKFGKLQIVNKKTLYKIKKI